MGTKSNSLNRAGDSDAHASTIAELLIDHVVETIQVGTRSAIRSANRCIASQTGFASLLCT